MDDATLAQLRAQLEERKVSMDREIASMENEIRSIGVEQGDESGGLGNHFAEDGSSMTEAERLSTINSDLGAIRDQIDRALTRMDEGTYGICERCGQPIAEARLEAYPYVSYCITCQAELERQQAIRAGR